METMEAHITALAAAAAGRVGVEGVGLGVPGGPGMGMASEVLGGGEGFASKMW